MVPDNFLSGWEREFDPLKWIYVNVVFELFARGAGNLNTNFPPQTTDLWLHEVGPDVTCYVCKVPDYIHEAFLD